MALISLFVFLFGVVIGSFLNVVIFRLNTGKSMGGRSHCFSCERQLKWFELVPLFSYIFLAGRCRSCRSNISAQYPLVELVSGLLFLFAFRNFNLDDSILFSLPLFTFSGVIWSILLVIFVYDLRHQIIPDALVYAFIGLSFVRSLIFCKQAICVNIPVLYILMSGLLLFLFFFILWFISDGRWIGFGDAKLALGIGFYLGIDKGFSAIAYAFWIGAVVGISIISTQKILNSNVFKGLSSSKKTLTMKSAIPFAPFLILGTFLSEMFQSDIFHINSIFF